MIPGICVEQYACTADIQQFVKVTLIALCFVQLVPRGIVSKDLGPFYTARSRTHIHRRLKSLEEVLGKELEPLTHANLSRKWGR